MRQFVNEDAKAFSLDSQSRVPLFRQLADELRSRIADGMYKAGDVLPGIHELARMCHASAPRSLWHARVLFAKTM